MEKDAKVIFSPQLANYLLKRGYKIIKLKPKHNTPDQTVYVFEIAPGFFETVNEWSAQCDTI